MDDQIKIYDTVRGNQSFLYYNSSPNGFNTTNSSKIKRSHWSNIFTWKKKVKSSQNSIINYPFHNNELRPVISQNYGSISASTGVAYTYAPPPGRVAPNSYAPVVRHSLVSTTIHSSIKSSSPNKQHRSSLFYSPWESLHDQSVNHFCDHCTCATNGTNGIVDTYCSAKEKHKSIKGQSSKPVIQSANDSFQSRRYSRMDLYSLEEENNYQKQNEFKSKSSDSIYKPKHALPTHRLKTSKSSTTLSSNPYKSESIVNRNMLKDTPSATINERFLRFFKKSSTDPFNSIASRKSILECEVSAYDLIKQNLKSSSFEEDVDVDVDDDLSDNAIENENNVVNVGKALNSNRKSIESNSYLIESKSNGFRSGSESDTAVNSGHSSANNIRIAGQGMHFISKSPIYSKFKINESANKTFNDITKSYDSNTPLSSSSSTSNWSASPGLSDQIIAVPEPDYDNDENDFDQISSDNVKNLANFQHLKVSYSPPLSNKRISNGIKQNNVIYEKVVAKNVSARNEQYSKLNYLKNDNRLIDNTQMPSKDSDHCIESEDEEYNGLPYRSTTSEICHPPLPPPPCLPPSPPLPPTIYKSALKSSSTTPKMNSYQCELKDKLNFGVKSILKKTLIINDHFSRKLNDCENEVTLQKTSSETCDYLKTYKEFKESRLKGDRHRKHVHFKSQSDETLIIDQIRETIVEVDEIDEPIYDDVALPSFINSDNNCESNHSNDLNYSNDKHNINNTNNNTNNNINNNINKSKILNSSSNSTSSTSSDIRESDSNDNELDKEDKDHKEDKAKETIEFSEFDPSEDSSSSWMKRLDLKAKEQSLTKSRDLSIDCTSNSDASKETYKALRGPKGPSKNVFPSPAANYATNGDHKNSSTVALRDPIVMPLVNQCSAQETNPSPNASIKEELISKQRGKSCNTILRQNKSKSSEFSITSSNSDTKSFCSHIEKSDTRIDNKEKELTLPVSRDISTNKKQISETSNTEIEIYKPNHSMGALNHSSSSPDCEAIKPTKSLQSSNDFTLNSNPFVYTISITNGSNNQFNQNNNTNNQIKTNHTNVRFVSLNSDLIPFESIGSSHSYSSYDCETQSFSHSLNTESIEIVDKKAINESPITILCSNSNDKIIINVPLDNHFDNINDHIYEELDTEPIYVDTDDSLENVKSIFDGASKDEILEFLEDAKERVREDILVDASIDNEILEAIDVIEDIDESQIINTKNIIETTISSNRRNRTSNVSNSSTDSSATTASSIDIDDDILKCAMTNSASAGQLVERNDSGVGAETSKPSRLRKLSLNDEVEHQCADCEMHVDPNEDESTGLLHYPLFCHRCDKKRSERKEIISEIVDTEFKYGRDLRIIREEFYRPIEIAGLLSKEQLKGVFLNLDELIAVNSKFSEKLQDAIDIATEQGDEDFTTVNIGKLFRDSSAMLHSFEIYCVRQGSAALLLNHLEKEKELLRIFLRVSQMENTLLRRMNLRSFLVVPVQRVTKYPLLLNRLYKVTPYHHRDREALKESQQKVELHLEHINQQTKGTIGTTTRIWRRISNLSTSHRRLNNVDDIGNIKIRKAALEILKWNQEETQFVTIGKVFFTSITDYTVNKKAKSLKFLTASALLVTLGRPNHNYRPDLVNTGQPEKDLMFPRDNTGITDAVLLLIKEKCGRYVLCKEILHLGSCVVSSESDSDDMFEIHEQTTKDSFLFKAESISETKDWLKQLRYHSKDLGNWRRRRAALANIMMVRQ